MWPWAKAQAKTMNNIFFRIVLYILIAYLGLTLFIYTKQDSLLFLPTQDRHQLRSKQSTVVPYELLQDGIHLRGWLVQPALASKKLLIYYGGNGEDIFYNIDDFIKLQGVATLLVQYRGYGTSDGSPSEALLFSDALSIYDDVRVRLQPTEIMLMGRSLGSGVACYVASQKTVNKTILVTPFDSMTNVVKSHYPWLPVELLLRHPFNSIQHVQTIKAPLLLIYGGQDRIIPNRHTENLIRHLPEPAKVDILQIPAAGHNDIHAHASYWPAIQSHLHRQN